MTPEMGRLILLYVAVMTGTMTLIVAVRYVFLPARRHNIRHVGELGAGTVLLLFYVASVLYERMDRGDGWSGWMLVAFGGMALIVDGLLAIQRTLRRERYGEGNERR